MGVLTDLRFALRSLAKSPGFASVAVATLALGIGATVAIFSIVDAVLLKPLPYADPASLTRIYTQIGERGIDRFNATTAEFLALRRDTRSWESIDAWRTGGANLGADGEALRVTAAQVTGDLLARTLRVAPAIGRVIAPADDELGAPLVAVISDRLWRRAFGADPAVVGRSLLLNGAQHTVIGVMPEEFVFPVGEADVPDLWVPIRIDPALPANDHSVAVLGRLKSGVTLEQARAELDAYVAAQASSTGRHHLDPEEHALATHALADDAVRSVRPALRVLFGAVSFLMLIACVNVANLLLSRAEARRQEIAIRGALGAGVARFARQFAVEGLLLSSLGAAAGVVLAYVGLGALASIGVAGFPQAAEAHVDARTLAFAVLVSMATGVAFGCAPLAHVMRGNLHAAIKTASASTTGATGTQRFRHALIVGQLALALVLLAGTGLMLRTFLNLQSVDAGFDPTRVLTMQVMLRGDSFADEGAREVWTRLAERLTSLPSVDSAALTSGLPPVAEDLGWGTIIEGFVPAEGGPVATSAGAAGERVPSIDHYQVVTPGYFDTLRIGLVAGRLFDARDDARGANAVIVNETLARAVWGNESALGHRIMPALKRDWFTIVGVVSDAKNAGVDKPTGTAVYFPYTQVPAGTGLLRSPYLTVRAAAAAGGAAPVVADVRAALRDLDPTLPLARIRTLDDVVASSQSRPRFVALLLTVFAGVSLALAGVGIYGVIAYSVAQRAKEFGIRMALGAQPAAVLARVLGGGLLLTAGGLLIGIAGALALARLLSGLLFGVAPWDPATYAGVALLLGAFATFSSYLAARRATKLDPLAALRTD